jgi:putative alpha-1,2-mannosidase
MSAWYVFGALGFHPLVPGRPGFVVTTALVARASLRTRDGQQRQCDRLDACGANRSLRPDKQFYQSLVIR